MPHEAQADSDVMLLHAVLLVHGGSLAPAAEICRRLLARDEYDAGANYVLGLCREGSGERRAAAHYYRVAACLAEDFAMPRLHLGLLARRSGNLDEARRELERALELLGQEDASRLLLFGGGFTRGALSKLCDSELRSCRVAA
jgi:chemotaxis protein methyltransferase CheR